MNSLSRGSVAIVTGSAGLVGAEAVRQFAALGLDVVGIDNDQRRVFFGEAASTRDERIALQREIPRYRHLDIDIRDEGGISGLFADAGADIALVVHAAAQPSHDWAASDPAADFAINATATLGLLNCVRRHCPSALFILMSTNKVYGDHPNRLPLVETVTRWELPEDHAFFARGIDESLSIDQCAHSVFGVSKVAADLMTQEFGRRFRIPTVCFRAGCITGPRHRGAFLHGFLAHLCASAAAGAPYSIIGYKGKQVRDNLHCADLAAAFREVFAAPKIGAVYNIGGGRQGACSIVEALDLCEALTGRAVERAYRDEARFGDHVWWISDVSRFQSDYPLWKPTRDAATIIAELLADARRVASRRL